jgi:hypothetical protein
MAFPLGTPYAGATANPAYSGTFIPEVWSGKLLEKFYSSTVLHAISNTDYEGEISSKGDKVIIRTKPTITIRDYTAEQALAAPDRPAASTIELLIDKGKYFNLVLDDVLGIQSDINLMSMWSDDAGEQMKIVIDREILRSLVGAPAAANRGATAGAISSSINLGVTTSPLALAARNPGAGEVEVVDLIVRMGQALDEQNIPEQGRWLIVPAWVASTIKRSELRDASLSGDGASILRNGRLGMVDRFTIYSSNLLPTGTTGGVAAGEWVLFAGHAHGLTFASQFTKLETLRAETTFGDLLRGLQVYGSKVVDGTALAQAIVVPA